MSEKKVLEIKTMEKGDSEERKSEKIKKNDNIFEIKTRTQFERT